MYWCKKIVLIFVLCVNAFCFNLDKKDTQRFNLMQAFLYENSGNFDEAKSLLLDLYKQTNEKIYLKKSIKIAFVNKSSDFAELLKKGRIVLKNDPDFIRIDVSDMLLRGRFDLAKIKLLDLVKKDKDAKNYSMLGMIYIYEQDYEASLKYLKKAYELENSEKNLMPIVEVLDKNLFKTKEAISILRDYIDKNGCSVETCEAAGLLYLKSNDSKKAIEIYEKLYEDSLDERYLQTIIQIFAVEKEYEKAVKYLEKKYPQNDILVDLYAKLGRFNDAYNFAKHKFENLKEPIYQARMAIYKYEDSKNKLNQNILNEVVNNFEKSVYLVNDPIFYNYYGYLLIDHDIDAKKGLELAKKAYELDPESFYIVDSIAWGEYKVGDCKAAKNTISKIINNEDFINSPEAKEHIKFIDECLKKGAK
ncbi:tetratricopeptide repeat protein [Campylobacter sputorum]|uniref:tetratricopeptide repeat protein n=1 Tax=Campylobacter sputorum TaxID=206 RepID=UPI001E615362|nr:hypothetical protein [Campylobacter sputorum]